MQSNDYKYSSHYDELMVKIENEYQRLPDGLAGQQAKRTMAAHCRNKNLPGINACVNKACNNISAIPYTDKMAACAQISILQRHVEDCMRDILSDVFVTLNRILIRARPDPVLIDEVAIIQAKIEQMDTKETKRRLEQLKTAIASKKQGTCDDMHVYTDVKYCIAAVTRITG